LKIANGKTEPKTEKEDPDNGEIEEIKATNYFRFS
jgi:hypothetical protein